MSQVGPRTKIFRFIRSALSQSDWSFALAMEYLSFCNPIKDTSLNRLLAGKSSKCGARSLHMNCRFS